MPKKLFFLDSTYLSKYYDTIIGNHENNFYHTFNICFSLNNPLQNLKSITLRSVEIPVGLNNIRSQNGSSTISFNFTNSTYTDISITVSVGTASYTGVDTI